MNTDHDELLRILEQIDLQLQQAILLRQREIAAAQNQGFNPDDTTRHEED